MKQLKEARPHEAYLSAARIIVQAVESAKCYPGGMALTDSILLSDGHLTDHAMVDGSRNPQCAPLTPWLADADDAGLVFKQADDGAP